MRSVKPPLPQPEIYFVFQNDVQTHDKGLTLSDAWGEFLRLRNKEADRGDVLLIMCEGVMIAKLYVTLKRVR